MCTPILTHASLGSPESIPKRHLNWFSRFLYCSRQKGPTLHNGPPLSPQNCPCTWGIWTPSNTCFLGPPDSASQMASRSVQPFCKAHDRKSVYFTMGCPFSPQNCPYAWEDLDPYLIHSSLCSPESIKQVTSRSFQPFWQGSRL